MTRVERNLEQICEKRVWFEEQLVDVDIEPATPVIKKPPPTALPGRNVFLEGYTNSPEWTHFENPVIYMEEEVLPEELDEDVSDPLQDDEILASGSQGRGPNSEHTQPRQHPLSQVTNAEDMTSPPPNDLLALGIRQQEVGRHGAPVLISDDGDDNVSLYGNEDADGGNDYLPMTIDNDNIVEQGLFVDEGDSEDEEPQDDTFEFLLR